MSITCARIQAYNLFVACQAKKLCVTAGVCSDHIDLKAGKYRFPHVKLVVTLPPSKPSIVRSKLEVTGSNVASVAEHIVMLILLLVKNFVPAHEMIEHGDWNVADISRNVSGSKVKLSVPLG